MITLRACVLEALNDYVKPLKSSSASQFVYVDLTINQLFQPRYYQSA